MKTYKELQKIINAALEYYDEIDRYFFLKDLNFKIEISDNIVAIPEDLVLKVYKNNIYYTDLKLDIYNKNWLIDTIKKLKSYEK